MSRLCTRSGKIIDVLKPDPSLINVYDIAHALSNLCRFGGHVSRFYSVAEHSVNVAGILQQWGESPKVQLKGLLHDATEAYLVDMPSPIKNLQEMGSYRFIEAILEEAISKSFLLGAICIPEVKRADQTALRLEVIEFMLNPEIGPEVIDYWRPVFDGEKSNLDALVTRVGLNPEEARTLFLEKYLQLSELIRTGRHKR